MSQPSPDVAASETATPDASTTSSTPRSGYVLLVRTWLAMYLALPALLLAGLIWTSCLSRGGCPAPLPAQRTFTFGLSPEAVALALVFYFCLVYSAAAVPFLVAGLLNCLVVVGIARLARRLPNRRIFRVVWILAITLCSTGLGFLAVLPIGFILNTDLGVYSWLLAAVLGVAGMATARRMLASPARL